MADVSVIAQSLVAGGICNLASTRFRDVPLDKREEGWTEAWSDKTKDDDPNWKIDDDSISIMLSTTHPQLPLSLVQFRPAWLEQLVLRIAGVPHIVLNSSYASIEATGSLPFLRDGPPFSEKPILVGRRHPTVIGPDEVPCQNNILDYLFTHRGVDLDRHVDTAEKKALAQCFTMLITKELQNILLFLRYEDLDAWEQVYRKHYLRASSNNTENSWLAQFGGRFQAWSERAMARRRLGDFALNMTVQHAVTRAKQAYQSLETQLSEQNASFYLLGTETPSFVDALLWDHLADAMCDVHLVIVLSEFPRLVKYFQNIHSLYFRNEKNIIDDWRRWNYMQNARNAFQQLPTEEGLKSSSKPNFKDAIELMQSLSLHKHELQEVLDVAKEKREEEPWPAPQTTTKSNFYRWRMGDNFATPNPDPAADENNPQRQQLIKEQIRNDQLWISGVVGMSALAVFFMQGFQKAK